MNTFTIAVAFAIAAGIADMYAINHYRHFIYGGVRRKVRNIIFGGIAVAGIMIGLSTIPALSVLMPFGICAMIYFILPAFTYRLKVMVQ